MKLSEFIRHLIDYSRKTIIVVEGKKDKEVLEKIGICNVNTINDLKKIDLKRYEKALILTDNDKKGKALYKNIKDHLFSEGILDDYPTRMKFFKEFRVYKVEDLKKKIDKLLYYIDYENYRLSLQNTREISNKR